MTYTAAQFEADFVGFSSVMAEVQVSRTDALTVALSDPALTDVQKYDITKNELASVYYDLAAEAEGKRCGRLLQLRPAASRCLEAN